MIEKIYAFAEKYNMLTDCNHIVVGLSGGADSVCLLLVLHSIIEQKCLDIKLTAIHVNHGIRGDEAVRDEEFAGHLCKELGVEYVCHKADIPNLAKSEGMTEEEAGRKVRYAVFADYVKSGSRIAVAHHMDDQAETMLMNMFRGTGLKGACGIAPVRDNIIRPLLCVTRQEIEEYLAITGQAYVTDSTNSDNAYTRNRLRNELLPYVREHFNGNVVKHLAGLSAELRQCEEYVESVADTFIDENVSMKDSVVVIDAAALRKVPDIVKSKVVLKALKNLSAQYKDIYRVHIEAVLGLLDVQVGKQVDLPYSMVAVRTYETIELRRHKGDKMRCDTVGDIVTNDVADCNNMLIKEILPEEIIALGGIWEAGMDCRIYDGIGLRRLKAVRFEVLENTFDQRTFNIEKNDYTKFYNCDRIKGTLCVRFRCKGDVIVVTNDGNRRKLKKEFIDRKVPREYRDSVLLLAEGDNVLWAAGMRRSNDYLVEEDTKKVLKVSLEFKEDE